MPMTCCCSGLSCWPKEFHFSKGLSLSGIRFAWVLGGEWIAKSRDSHKDHVQVHGTLALKRCYDGAHSTESDVPRQTMRPPARALQKGPWPVSQLDTGRGFRPHSVHSDDGVHPPPGSPGSVPFLLVGS